MWICTAQRCGKGPLHSRTAAPAGEPLSSVRQLVEGQTLQVVCLAPKTEAEKAALALEAKAAAELLTGWEEVVDPVAEAAEATARAVAAGVNPNVFLPHAPSRSR